MKPVFHNVEQTSDEWFKLRLGRYTASSFKDVFAGKTTAAYKKAIYRPVYESYAGEIPESFATPWMERGQELEPIAVRWYEEQKGVKTNLAGFWSLGKWVGCSPDRLINEDGLLEVKAPAWNTQIEYLVNQEVPDIYKWQVHGQIYVTGRDYCDFLSFHPNLPKLLIRVWRDEKAIEELKNKLDEAISESKKILDFLIDKDEKDGV